MSTTPLARLNHKIPPPILTLVIGGIMWLIAQGTERLVLDDATRLVAAGLLLTIGLAFLISGFLAFRQAKTTINPVTIEAASSLVTTGVFRISRNPMYVGFAALLMAFCCYLAAPFALVGVIVFVLFIHRFQILPEEQVMQDKFGTAFEVYRREVRRWL